MVLIVPRQGSDGRTAISLHLGWPALGAKCVQRRGAPAGCDRLHEVLVPAQLEFSRRGGDTAVTAALDAPGYDDLQPHFRAYKYMLRENRSGLLARSELCPNARSPAGSVERLHRRVCRRQTGDGLHACKQQEILYDAGRSDIEPSEACADISCSDVMPGRGRDKSSKIASGGCRMLARPPG